MSLKEPGTKSPMVMPHLTSLEHTDSDMTLAVANLNSGWNVGGTSQASFLFTGLNFTPYIGLTKDASLSLDVTAPIMPAPSLPLPFNLRC